jgi:hypothetical protein
VFAASCQAQATMQLAVKKRWRELKSRRNKEGQRWSKKLDAGFFSLNSLMPCDFQKTV